MGPFGEAGGSIGEVVGPIAQAVGPMAEAAMGPTACASVQMPMLPSIKLNQTSTNGTTKFWMSVCMSYVYLLIWFKGNSQKDCAVKQ